MKILLIKTIFILCFQIIWNKKALIRIYFNCNLKVIKNNRENSVFIDKQRLQIFASIFNFNN